MNDFFARQEEARTKTRRLLFFFGLAVLLVILFIYWAVTAIYFWGAFKETSVWDWGRFFTVAGGTLAVVLAGSWYKIRELGGGGYRVAEMLGGRLIPSGTENPEERRLLNVVEEMAIASGMPVPSVYLLEGERSINAFAAGFGTKDAILCVTRGALSLLSRDELQGVMAHEFSHILNGDTLINIRLLGWLHGLLLISLLGEKMLRGIGRIRGRSGPPLLVLGLALYILGYVGVFLGSLIKSAVSRQREYLADASAVQFTRNPSGLAGALKKVGSLTSRISHPQVSEASHMYFCDGLHGTWTAALATHPPLLERILRLEPRFDGIFPEVKPLPVPDPPPVRPLRTSRAQGRAAEVLSGAAVLSLLETVGTPMKEHVEKARTLIDSLPEPVRTAARKPLGAWALVLLLLLDRKEEVCKAQWKMIEDAADPPLLSEVRKLLPALPSLAPSLRLPLLDLALPALRTLSQEQYGKFRDIIDRLAAADGRVSVFEFLLRQILGNHLEARFGRATPRVVQIYGIRGVIQECSCVLSLLARQGQKEERGAAEAFSRGARVLRDPRAEPEFLAREQCRPSELERALEALAWASPPIKRKVLAACLECLNFDGRITVEEAELFRAVAEALGCPTPPPLSN